MIPLLEMEEKLGQVRAFLKQSEIGAWLIYDFRGCDPTGTALLGALAPHSRQYAIIIAQEDPIIIIKPRIESHELVGLSSNLLVLNSRSQIEFQQAVEERARSINRIAVNFSTNPQTDTIPAGRLALLRSTLPETEFVSGENLMQIIHSVLTKKQLASQENAARMCTRIMEQAFSFIAERIGDIRECDVADFIFTRFHEEKLETVNTPIVAVQSNSANPHYTPGKARIRKDQIVMIDLWAKWEVFADITWMGYTGNRLPTEIQDAWDAVLLARKTATNAIKPNIPSRFPDEEAREILIAAGYKDAILHRTGHSIDTTLHGKGANLDGFEMPETRLLLPDSVVSVEPGVYLPKQFGIRSEINVMITKNGSKVTTPPQESILYV
jgi:Xaa-Pro aminopeptidase